MHSARRVLVVGAGWLAAALLATLVALAGIRLVGESLTGTPGGVRSERDVARALAADQPAADATPDRPPAAGPPAGTRGPAGTPGGIPPGTPPPGSGPPGAVPSEGTASGGSPPGGNPSGGTPATGTAAAGGPPATPAPVSFTTDGGTALARCEQGQAYLVSWSPRPGFRVVQHEQGPDDEVKVRFEGGGRTVRLEIVCRGGVPVARREQ